MAKPGKVVKKEDQVCAFHAAQEQKTDRTERIHLLLVINLILTGLIAGQKLGLGSFIVKAAVAAMP